MHCNRGGVDTEARTVTASTISALIVAQRSGLDSVVFPALGTGIIGQLADALSAYAVLGGIETFRNAHLSNHLPRMVTVGIYGNRRAYDVWVKMMEIGPLTLVGKEIAMRAGGRQFNEAAWHRGMAQMIGTINWAREQDEKPGN